jgi:two-component system NarL family sensor kinase
VPISTRGNFSIADSVDGSIARYLRGGDPHQRRKSVGRRGSGCRSDRFSGETQDLSLLAVQLFILALSISMLLLGALIDELRSAEQTRRKLVSSLLTSQDSERRRISRDVHDSTGQNLIAASLIAERLGSMIAVGAESLMRQLCEVLQRSVREVRTVSYLLHPPLLDECGLVTAMRHYIDGYSARSGIRVDLNVEENSPRLPADAELALFCVVQEALSNVSRHTTNKDVTIKLAHWPDPCPERVDLIIEDLQENSSIVLAQTPARAGELIFKPGVGLMSMRERLEQIGGSMEIETKFGGTCVRARIPLRVRGS